MKDKAINDAMVSIENRVRHIYNQGYADGREDNAKPEVYQRGLEDAWEAARKIVKIWGEASDGECLDIFGYMCIEDIMNKFSASEAIEKLKEYGKNDKSCATCAHILDDDFCEIFIKGGYCEKYSEWTPKQTEEKTDKSCESCRFVDLKENEFPCSACSASHTFRWEARKGAEE